MSCPHLSFGFVFGFFLFDDEHGSFLFAKAPLTPWEEHKEFPESFLCMFNLQDFMSQLTIESVSCVCALGHYRCSVALLEER